MSDLEVLIKRSTELEKRLYVFADIGWEHTDARRLLTHMLCRAALEHAQSSRVLIGIGNHNSGLAILRLQFEAQVRAMWVAQAADGSDVKRLAGGVKDIANRRNEKMPMLSEMLKKLEQVLPSDLMKRLSEFKEHSWKPLSSYVHGGSHVLLRQLMGHPEEMLVPLIKLSNGVSIITGNLLLNVSGDTEKLGSYRELQREFEDCLPPRTDG